MYGVYTHIPWCRSRCHYCSFNVRVTRSPPWEAYVDALLAQWSRWRPLFDGPPSTLYLGGGTPSLMPPEQLERLVRGVDAAFVEMEANPEDLESAQAWAALGVDRLSVGAQTFDPRQTAFLNRAHRAETLLERLAPLPSLFRTWSADLIFGLPGQGLAELDADIDRLLSVDPPHVSLYGLTVHPGTPLEKMMEGGRLSLDDELQGEMLDHVVRRLGQSGRPRYEVSNFARPDHRSPHNELVWRGMPYAGLGAGAHGWLPDGRRTVGEPDPERFIATCDHQEELPDPHQRALDLVITMMRHVDGLPLERLRAEGFGLDAGHLRAHVQRGTLRVDHAVALVGSGWMHGDALVAAVARALVPAA